MAKVHADPDVSLSEHLAQERRLQQCLRVLRARGWQQCLQSLATHTVEKHLARPYDIWIWRCCARLSVGCCIRSGRTRPLIIDLVVDGTEPAEVAAERGVSRLMLTEQPEPSP
jgi:hypothetical protein